MKACDKPGCKSPRIFYNQAFGHKVCLSWRMTYHSQLDFIKIPDAKLAKEAVETNSSWLKAMHIHSKTYNIEDLFKGFKGELSNFVEKNEEVRKRLKEAEGNDEIGEIDEIEKEAFELKKQIDSSEMMRNFTFHRFQINKTKFITRLKKVNFISLISRAYYI